MTKKATAHTATPAISPVSADAPWLLQPSQIVGELDLDVLDVVVSAVELATTVDDLVPLVTTVAEGS